MNAPHQALSFQPAPKNVFIDNDMIRQLKMRISFINSLKIVHEVDVTNV